MFVRGSWLSPQQMRRSMSPAYPMVIGAWNVEVKGFSRSQGCESWGTERGSGLLW